MLHLGTREIPPDSLTDGTRPFWAYVTERLQNGCVPRADFDPVGVPSRCLPWMVLFERTGPYEFRCRVFGTALVARYGRDMTGHSLAQMITGEPREEALALYERVAVDRNPSVTVVEIAAFEKHLVYERVIVPLVDIAGHVRWTAAFIHVISNQPVHSRHTILDMAATA